MTNTPDSTINLLHKLHLLAWFLSRVKTTQCSSAELFLGA